MRRRVEWAQAALDDVFEQARYIAADDPRAARGVGDKIRKAGDDLGVFATGHPGRVAGTYEKSVRGLPYIIVYKLLDPVPALPIARVIHAARDWRRGEWSE